MILRVRPGRLDPPDPRKHGWASQWVTAVVIAVALAACEPAQQEDSADLRLGADQLIGLWESVGESALDGSPYRSTFEFSDDGTVVVVYGAGGAQSIANTAEYQLHGNRVTLVGSNGGTVMYSLDASEPVLQDGGGPRRLTRGRSRHSAGP